MAVLSATWRPACSTCWPPGWAITSPTSPAMFTTTAPSSWCRPDCSMCWRWWMFTRSRRERKADAEDESEPFRGVDVVRAVRLNRHGDRDQEDRFREAPVWALSVWLLRRLADRSRLADALRSRLNPHGVRFGHRTVRDNPQESVHGSRR